MAIDEALLLEKYKQNLPKDYEAFMDGLKIINDLIATLEESYLYLDTVTNLALCVPLKDIHIITTCSFDKLKTIYNDLIITKNEAYIYRKNYKYVFDNFEGIDSTTKNTEKFFNKKLSATLDKKSFTIETIVMSPKKYVTDIYNGLSDIEDRIIKTITNPATLVKENPKVILDAIYYIADYNFKIAKPLQKVMFKESKLITKLPIQDITKSIRKILTGKYWKEAITFIVKNDIFYGLNEFEQYANKLLASPDLSYLDKLVLLYTILGNVPDASDIDSDLLNEIMEKMSFVNLISTQQINPMMVYNVGEKMLKECDKIACLFKRHYHSQIKRITQIKKKLKIENIRELNYSTLELNKILNQETKNVKTRVIMNMLLEKVINGEVPNYATFLADEAKKINNEINSIFNYIEPVTEVMYTEEMINNLKIKYDKDFNFLVRCFLNNERDLYSMSYFDRQDVINKAKATSEKCLLSTSQFKILKERGLI